MPPANHPEPSPELIEAMREAIDLIPAARSRDYYRLRTLLPEDDDGR